MGSPLLVLDEPTANLDPQGIEEVYAALGELVAAGLTVREAAARLKIGKTALYKALEGAGAQRSGETRTGA